MCIRDSTLTTDYKATIKQINQLEEAGADIVRVSCPDEESTKALKKITQETKVPIVADIHFHYKRAIESAISGAKCLRINPGNIGSIERIKEVIKAAKDYDCAIRVGVNAGSLEKNILEKYKEPCPEALIESAEHNIKLLEDNDFFNFKVSVKSSDVFLAIKAYEGLSNLYDYPLHLGITEAGSLVTGSIKSSIGIGKLLMQGIGDTIRVSLSADPIEEVNVLSEKDDFELEIKANELTEKLSTDLATTLSYLPNINVLSFGQNATKPVIRGYSGNRFFISKNGNEFGDLSSTALDHAITLDLLQIDAIELIRGPKTLIYGPNTVGGVINTTVAVSYTHLPLPTIYSV